MADFEKLNDDELDNVSGALKFNIGRNPVPVRPYPNGPVLYTLFQGDYLVTDGQTKQDNNGVTWYHVYTAYGEGCVEGWRL